MLQSYISYSRDVWHKLITKMTATGQRCNYEFSVLHSQGQSDGSWFCFVLLTKVAMEHCTAGHPWFRHDGVVTRMDLYISSLFLTECDKLLVSFHAQQATRNVNCAQYWCPGLILDSISSIMYKRACTNLTS